MKFSIVSAAVVLALGVAPYQAFAANDGTITFTGGLTPTTCQVEGHDPGHGNADKKVEMHHLPVGEFQAPASTGVAVPFEIHIGGNGDASCTDGHTAYVEFDGLSPSIDQATGYLNPDPGGAKNVQIQILNKDGTVINLADGGTSEGVKIVNNAAIIPMDARYYSANGQATSGEVNARVGYEVVYD
jgi:major type 1 subunit fimbrin (pilin)